MNYEASVHLELLKPFQRATVDYVFGRLFCEEKPTDQFLVADEVGLGKTMVARGVVAKAIERLQRKVERVDIVYICSNQAIAEQNIKSLNVIGSDTKPINTRLTLLPLELEKEGGIASRPINLISLTPGTALDLKSSLGTAKERALIYEMLRKRIRLRHAGIQKVFKGGARKNWPYIRDRMRHEPISEKISERFNKAVDDGLIERIRAAGDLARRFKEPNYPEDQRPAAIIGELRRLLAKICVDALTPDLIILDEFQRFAELLHEHDPVDEPEKAAAAELANALFSYTEANGSKAKILLLSATPYRMLTLNGDGPEEGHHYLDFLRTMKFLFGEEEGSQRVHTLEKELLGFRRALQSMPQARAIAHIQKEKLHSTLSQVIARTERVDSSDDRNSLVKEVIPELKVQTDDLREARAVAKIAELAGAPGTVEYWKSAPYLVNFMRGYKLKDQLQTLKMRPSSELRRAVRELHKSSIKKDQIEAFAQLPFRNARMRALAKTALSEGLDRALWIPPSRPSFGQASSATKTLVFSDWSMVPDAIAALLSHEASRRMGMSAEVASRTRRPIGIEELMPILYPSPSLATLVDPLALEKQFGRAATYEALHEQACHWLSRNLDAKIVKELSHTEPRLLAFKLDQLLSFDLDWEAMETGVHESIEESDAMARSIRTMREALAGNDQRTDLEASEVINQLATQALGSPAVCALRAIARLDRSSELRLDDPAFLSAAVSVALGFRSLYNQPESRALLKEKSPTNYWREIFNHAGQNDLSAVLDEYLHQLSEAERVEGIPPAKCAEILASRLVEVVAILPSQIALEQWSTKGRRLVEETFSIRARFATRFAAKAEEEKGAKRLTQVQAAFKSPFRPFVVASTSIGQEGLDFHPYCSRVVHWNLPRNPVEIEQREGRVHRFKNHTVRRNVSTAFFDAPLKDGGLKSPWDHIFDAAEQDEIGKGNMGDIVPYWIYPGDLSIERVPLIPPFSREKDRYIDLIKSLATYRLAFGQPRQDELIELFADMEEELMDELAHLQLSLRPPDRAHWGSKE